MKIMNFELSAMQIFSILAIILFIGSMVFMYKGQSAPSTSQNVTHNQGTILGNASFFDYKSYIYFDTNQNITDSVVNKINPYVDYIDYNKGIISLKDTDYEANVYAILNSHNVSAYVPTEFMLVPDVLLANDNGTTNMTVSAFKFSIPTKMEFQTGDIISVSIPAILVNNHISRYGNPQMQISKEKKNVLATVVSLKSLNMKCYVNWQDQFKLNKSDLSKKCNTTSGTLNLETANYFYMKNPISSIELSSLKSLDCVDYVNGQTVYLKDNCTPNFIRLYNIINESNIVFPDVSVECTKYNELNNSVSCAPLVSNATKEDLNYIYSIRANGTTNSIDYISKKHLNINDTINATIDVYVSGNKILPDYQKVGQ